jgi:hypothetical protein
LGPTSGSGQLFSHPLTVLQFLKHWSILRQQCEAEERLIPPRNTESNEINMVGLKLSGPKCLIFFENGI